MSDDIRIYGGGGQPQGDDPRRHRAEALSRFKRGHKSGDLVTGVFLRLEPVPPGTAWVSLEGAALLAALPDEMAELARRIAAGQGAGATPTGVTEADFPIKRGQSCYFVLEALEPEPVLRMLGSGGPKAAAAVATEARWQSILRLPLTQLAARYTQKRSSIDNLLQQKLWTTEDLDIEFPRSLPESLTDFSAVAFAEEKHDPESPQGRYAAFILEAAAKEDFEELETYRAALVENLRPYGLLGFFFAPWLCPAARGLELAFFRQRSGEAASPDRAATMQGVTYKLQGSLPNMLSDWPHLERRELAGLLDGNRVQRALGPKELGPDDPDLLRQLLALKPEETRRSFSRKA